MLSSSGLVDNHPITETHSFSLRSDPGQSIASLCRFVGCSNIVGPLIFFVWGQGEVRLVVVDLEQRKNWIIGLVWWSMISRCTMGRYET